MPATEARADKRKASPGTSGDFWLGLLLYTIAGFILLPGASAIASAAFHQGQLHYAIIVLGFAAVILFLDQREELRFEFRLSRPALASLGAAFLCVLAGVLSGTGLFIIPALALALYSVSVWAFGARVKPYAIPLFIAFAGYTVAVVIFPISDWQLRLLAGEYAASIFSSIGSATGLRVVGTAADPSLLLRVGEQTFRVAPECNGFGVISSTALLGLLLGVYRRFKLFDLVLVIVAMLFLGFVFNLIRIVVIIGLAPVVGEAGYDIMHEVVGTSTFLTALVLAWWLCGPRDKESGGASSSAPIASSARVTPQPPSKG